MQAMLFPTRVSTDRQVTEVPVIQETLWPQTRRFAVRHAPWEAPTVVQAAMLSFLGAQGCKRLFGKHRSRCRERKACLKSCIGTASGSATSARATPQEEGQSKETIDPFSEAVEVEVMVVPGLCVRVLEASLAWQERLIDEAVEALEADPQSVDADPYGVALWPAAQVLAQAAAAHAADLKEKAAGGVATRVLEIGAGCGLASLAMAALGVDVLATDLRELPLSLLAESARRQGLEARLSTQVFDVRNNSVRLPEADLVMASDLVYEASTARALARRVAEARDRGSAVLISDIGRPNREAFLNELRRLRPYEPAEFACHGVAALQDTPVRQAAGGFAGTQGSKDVQVYVLELPAGGPASVALRPESPSIMVRPADHGHVL